MALTMGPLRPSGRRSRSTRKTNPPSGGAPTRPPPCSARCAAERAVPGTGWRRADRRGVGERRRSGRETSMPRRCERAARAPCVKRLRRNGPSARKGRERYRQALHRDRRSRRRARGAPPPAIRSPPGCGPRAALPGRRPPSRAPVAFAWSRARLPSVAAAQRLPRQTRVAMLKFMVSPRGREALAPETFRPWMALRTVVMGAATLWIAVFLALALMQGATRSSFFSAAFFVVLFTACSFFYNRLAFTVTDTGLTVRTVAAERTVSFSDILRVDVVPGLLGTSYAVRTRLGSLTFSSLLAGHQRLCDLIVRGARLS